MHPLTGPTAAKSGAYGMRAGDRIVTGDSRTGVADEFLHDGDVLVTYDDGTFDVVRWNWLRKA